MQRFIKWTVGVIAVTTIGLFSGCGGASSSSSDGSENPNSSLVTKTGYVYDELVVNMPYQCSSYSGMTGEDGSFQYIEGESCTFALGEMNFAISAEKLTKGYVTPFDMTETKEEAYVLAAILKTASLYSGERMVLMDEYAAKIKNVSLKDGDTSVKNAFGNSLDDFMYVPVARAEIELLENVDENGTVIGDHPRTLATSISNDDEENPLDDIALDFIGDMTKDYLKSQVMSALGLDDDTEKEFDAINDKLTEISTELTQIEKQLEETIADFKLLFNLIDKTKYTDLVQSFDDLYNNIHGYQGEIKSTLSTRIGDVNLSKALSDGTIGNLDQDNCGPVIVPLFADPNYTFRMPTDDGSYDTVNMIGAMDYFVENEGKNFDESLKNLLSASKQVTYDNMPNIGDTSNSTSVVKIINTFNEELMNQLVQTSDTLQVMYNIFAMYAYLESSDTKGICSPSSQEIQLRYAASYFDAQKTFKDNMKVIQSLFDSIQSKLTATIEPSIISDPIAGYYNTKWIKATSINEDSGVSKIPLGDWNNSCLLYQFPGVTKQPSKHTYQGDFNQTDLTALCSHNNADSNTTLSFSQRCYQADTNVTVTQTSTPYLECEDLSLTYFGNVHGNLNVDTGYAADNGANVEVQDNYFTIYETTNLHNQGNNNYTIHGDKKSAFLQVNFDNNERALVQFDVKGSGAQNISLQCGEINTELPHVWSCGENKSEKDPAPGNGYSRQDITTPSGEKTWRIQVDGGGKGDPGQAALYVIPMQ